MDETKALLPMRRVQTIYPCSSKSLEDRQCGMRRACVSEVPARGNAGGRKRLRHTDSHRTCYLCRPSFQSHRLLAPAMNLFLRLQGVATASIRLTEAARHCRRVKKLQNPAAAQDKSLQQALGRYRTAARERIRNDGSSQSRLGEAVPTQSTISNLLRFLQL